MYHRPSEVSNKNTVYFREKALKQLFKRLQNRYLLNFKLESLSEHFMMYLKELRTKESGRLQQCQGFAGDCAGNLGDVLAHLLTLLSKIHQSCSHTLGTASPTSGVDICVTSTCYQGSWIFLFCFLAIFSSQQTNRRARNGADKLFVFI